MAEKHTSNFEQPIRGTTWLEPRQCRNCVFRYKTFFEINNQRIPCSEEDGWRKDNCHFFPYPNGKPKEVYDNTGECEYYEKET